MSDTLLITLALLSAALIIYHHAGYPVLLSWCIKNKPLQNKPFRIRQYKKSRDDKSLPSITIIIPAFNEEQWIEEKIRNLASLDYPGKKLQVIIACDGCTDRTVELAEQTIQEAICADIHFEILNFAQNRGKVAVINEQVPRVNTDIVALSDVSALLSVDSLTIAARHFKDAQVGVVNPNYCMTSNCEATETGYWRYQSKIKMGEACLGTLIGCHGAFYLFRTALFRPLDSDTINDDFILPMEIVKSGYSAVYEPRIKAIELEATGHKEDFQRRIRISKGNMQQVMKLITLFNPKYSHTAFAFFSGKGLRLFTPYLMLTCFISSCLLIEYPLFQFAVALQLFVYGLGLLTSIWPTLKRVKVLAMIAYLLAGHAANFIGGISYLINRCLLRKKRGTTASPLA